MADPTIVSGSVSSDGVDDFTGYRVTASYLVSATEGDGAAPTTEGRRSASVEPDGDFRMELPPMGEWEGPLDLIVAGRSGLALGKVSGLTAEDALDDVRIKADADVSPVVIEPSDDPTLGALARFSGRVIDSTGNGQRSGLMVVLWGIPPEGNDADAYPLGVAETGSGGYFAGPWPPELLAEAYAVVSGGDPIPVLLEGERLPKRILLVVDDVAADEHEGEHDETPPRAPDASDLAESTAFSQDAAGCTNFTTPNRTVEEVTFNAVVRTTQPAIKGSALPPRPTVPPKVIDRIAELAKLRPVFERVAIAERAGTSDGDGGRDGAVLLDTDGMVVTDTVRRPVESTRSGVRIAGIAGDAADAIDRVIRVADAMESTPVETVRREERAERMMEVRDLRRQPLRLEASVLSELAREPGDISPVRLLDAERTSLVRRFRTGVDLISGSPIDRFELDSTNQVDWDDVPYAYQASTIAHGHVLTFKQVWKADGYSLGDLLYSLPLAPGQQKLVSILDWERRETATRQERRTATEQLDASLAHDRDISDVVRTSLHERLDASSKADTSAIGGAIGGFIGPVIFGAAGGVSSAGSTARQTSARDVSASVMNRARDRTLQSASAVRGQRTTVVQTARQGESVRAQTEAIANMNHGHALTIEYFEVLRHFQVSQELAGVQECLFVPMVITAFSERKAYNWRNSLINGLRRRAMRGSFDALERVMTNWEEADFPDGRYADETLRHLDGELWMQISIPRPADTADDDFDAAAWTPYQPLLAQPARDVWDRYLGVAVPAQRAQIWNTRIAPGMAKRLVDHIRMDLRDGAGVYHDVGIDATLVSQFSQNGNLLVTFRPTGSVPSLTRADVNRVRISISGVTFPAAVQVLARTGSMRYRTDHMSHPLFENQAIQNDLSTTDTVEVLTPLDRREKRNPKARDRRLVDELVDHLNEHVEHYHRVIWLTMDPNRRYMLLDGVIAPDAGGRSVASVVDNQVIGIIGNSLVMPVVPGVRLDPTYEFAEETPEDLIHLYAADPPPPTRVSVPTRGVFAEAALGKCNSNEIIDDTRFWRWEEAPIPDGPTSIGVISTTSRRRTPPSVKPSDFPDALVRLQDVPEAPDPTGLAAAMELLGTKDLFRNLTGLALNQENAAAALKGVMTTAQSFASQGAALAQQKFLAGQMDRGLDLIKKARDKKEISPEQAQRLSESLFRGALGEKRPETPKLTDNEAVRKSMERVGSSENGEMRLTSPNGSVEVKTNNKAAKEGIDISIDPPLSPMKQPSAMSCWAAAGSMLESWRVRASMGITTVLDGLGGNWRKRFDDDTGLSAAETDAFATALGLTEEGPASYTIEGLGRLLQTHGPLWVVSDDVFENNQIVHARIVTAIKGDGSADGTIVTLADSATGGFTTETFTEFARRLEASDAVDFGAGIYHY